MVVAPPTTPEARPHGSDRESRSPSPPVLEDELARLAASAASDLREVMGLLDPIQGPVNSIRAYMAHESARDARTNVETMQAIIGRLCKRSVRESTDDHATTRTA
jgi:hypothetical protein